MDTPRSSVPHSYAYTRDFVELRGEIFKSRCASSSPTGVRPGFVAAYFWGPPAMSQTQRVRMCARARSIREPAWSGRPAHPNRRAVLVRRPIGWIGLPDFDQVAVGVAEVAADFWPAVDWRREEVGASLAPGLVDGLDVGDSDVQEAAHTIGILWWLENDVRLVLCRSAADVDDDPAVRERDDRRLAGEDDLAAKDVAVEMSGAFDVPSDDEVCERDSFAQRGETWHGCAPLIRARAPGRRPVPVAERRQGRRGGCGSG